MASLTADARQIFIEALHHCSVKRAFASSFGSPSDLATPSTGNCPQIDLDGVSRVLIVAMGKAGSSLLEAFLTACPLPPECALSGILIAPSAPNPLPQGIAYFAGGHPVPNEDSFLAAHAALDLLQSATSDCTSRTSCVFLISGGASAMLELPLDPAISLEDTITFHRLLVESGASITEINCVRKHFSAVKGGRLAVAAKGLPALTILLSDVPPGRLDTISSGPTLADSTTVEQCRGILAKYDLLARFPPPIRRFFNSNDLPETPKPGDLEQQTCVLLSSDDLADAARLSAERLGYVTLLDQTCDDWDYSHAADYLIERIRTLQQHHPRVCLISAGEVTVRVTKPPSGQTNHSGIGGRNLHFTLYGALRLAQDDRIAILSAGSDGIDGNSPAAGAVVDAQTLSTHRSEAMLALEQFESFAILDQLNAVIITGPTNNNLRDLRILLAEGKSLNVS